MVAVKLTVGDVAWCRCRTARLGSHSGWLWLSLEVVMQRRSDFIDTVRREEAGDVFLALAARAGIPTGRADEWFDEWRDF
jgi:hypothetical protein